ARGGRSRPPRASRVAGPSQGLLAPDGGGRLGDRGRRPQALLDVGEDVVDVLETDGQAHEARAHAGAGEGRLVELGVGRRGRVDDERADVTDVRDVRVELQRVDEGDARLVAAGELEGEDGAGALGGVLLRALVP